MAYEVLILFGLILLSGFFSGVETAFVSLTKSKIRYLKEQGTKGMELVEKLKSKPQRLIITILIGNNIVNIGASAFATVSTIRLLEYYNFPFADPVGVATGVMTLLILTFGEVIPKVYSQMHAVKVSLYTARTIRFLQILLFPLVVIFERFTIFMTRLAGGQHASEKLSEEEIKSIVHFGHKEGAIERMEKEIIHNVLDFDSKRVRDVMTPKHIIVGVQQDMTAQEALNVFLDSGFNRLVVFEKKQVVGIVSIWRILKKMKKNNEILIKDIMGKAVYVPQDMHLDEVFGELKKKKRHFALAVDKRTRVVGVITDQDLLDEFFKRPHDRKESI